MIDWLLHKFIFWRLKKQARTVSKEEFDSMEEGEPISPELAFRVMQGDPDAIAKLRGKRREIN